jgi:hypothetical protein
VKELRCRKGNLKICVNQTFHGISMGYHALPLHALRAATLAGRVPAAVLVRLWIPHGEFHDQGDANG